MKRGFGVHGGESVKIGLQPFREGLKRFLIKSLIDLDVLWADVAKSLSISHSGRDYA